MSTIREKNLATLQSLGFRVAKGLPVAEQAPALRPVAEIAARLRALQCFALYVATDDDDAPEAAIKRAVTRDQVLESFTPHERELYELSREEAHDDYVDTIGWRLENMWPLAWAFGFEEKPALGGEIPHEVIRAMLWEFLPSLEAPLSQWLETVRLRPIAELAAAEDLFYCAHNAARSAQLGGDTVPEGFHAVMDGGVIHERRHALTWMLSPDTEWDDTDLST